ncbi:hypothetical protein B0H21DRAFT_699628, partial [Amylocystis lapponica]
KRCDGGRPACGQCVRADRSEDCEYVDGQGLTQTQLLEQEVLRLEGCIAELESSTSQPIALHDPYTPFHQIRNAAQAAQPTNDPDCIVSTPMLCGRIFLNVPRFLNKISAMPTADDPQYPAVLRNAIFLLGSKFSRDPQIRMHQSVFLTRSLQHLPSAISIATPATILFVLQAEILLSYYFLDHNRRLEGAYHSNAAVSITLACRLNMTRSMRAAPSARNTDALGGTEFRLLPPLDDVEEGERINAFWSAFVLDKCWAVSLGTTSAFADDESTGTQIDVPWPLGMADYENHRLHPDVRSMRTVRSFLEDATGGSRGQSLLAMHAKAALLVEHATRVASRWDPNNPAFQARFQSLDNCIERFKQTVPPLARVDPARTDVIRSLLAVHALCHCATIQLHTPGAHALALNSRTLTAANVVVGMLRGVDLNRIDFVGSIMAILLTTVSEVVLRAIHVVRDTINPVRMVLHLRCQTKAHCSPRSTTLWQ